MTKRELKNRLAIALDCNVSLHYEIGRIRAALSAAEQAAEERVRELEIALRHVGAVRLVCRCGGEE